MKKDSQKRGRGGRMSSTSTKRDSAGWGENVGEGQTRKGYTQKLVRNGRRISRKTASLG